MAYLRKLHIRRKRPIPLEYLPFLRNSEAASIIRESLNLKDYQYDYWTIYESKRRGNKIKSKCLYSFGLSKRKPTIKSVVNELEVWKNMMRYRPKKNRYRNKYYGLLYAISRLPDKKWKQVTRMYLSRYDEE